MSLSSFPEGGTLALRMANGARPPALQGSPPRRLRRPALLAGGVAACGAWERDLARCGMACGGSFMLRRAARGEGAAEVDWVLGALPQADDPEAVARLSVGNCSLEENGGPNLIAGAGRTLVELPLIGD